MSTAAFYSRHRTWLLPILIVLGGIAISAGLIAMSAEPPTKPEVRATALVRVTPVAMEPTRLTVESQGMVQAKYHTNLVAQVSGEVVSVDEAFVRGGFVKQGQLLAEIDPTNYQVRMEEARAALASAQAALELEIAQGQVAEAEWREITDRKPPALGLRQPQLDQARAQVAAAQASLKQAQKDLARTRITAPFNALVAARTVSPGTFVSLGNSIGEVMDIARAEIRLPVANSALQFLVGDGVGAEVMLTGKVQGVEHQWPARIVRNEGVIDENTRMAYLVAEVLDPYHLSAAAEAAQAPLPLPFGSYVVAQITGRQLEKAVAIPRYLIRDGKVAVAEADKLVFKPVSVVRHSGGNSIVDGGLSEGDMLITTALDFPVEGMDVEILSKDAEAPQSPQPETASADDFATNSPAGAH